MPQSSTKQNPFLTEIYIKYILQIKLKYNNQNNGQSKECHDFPMYQFNFILVCFIIVIHLVVTFLDHVYEASI